jgi:hypothetical protein
VRDLEILLERAWDALDAWAGTGWTGPKAQRFTRCDEPDRDDSQWKFWVANCLDSPDELARKSRNGVSAGEYLKVMRDYAGALGVRSYPTTRETNRDNSECLPAPRLLVDARSSKPGSGSLWGDDEKREVDLSPAPVPLAVVAPRKPGPVPKHLYADSPQYREARDLLYECPAAPRGDADTLASAFGERADDEDAYYGITAEGRTNQKIEQDTSQPLVGERRIRRATSGEVALQVLRDWRPGGSVERFSRCLRRGPKTAEQRADYADLATRVAGAVVARAATIDAIAEGLCCDPKTVDQLVKIGKTVPLTA